MKKVNIQTTTVTQPGNEVLGTKEKKLYYLILTDGEHKMTINVGEKTYKEAEKLKTIK